MTDSIKTIVFDVDGVIASKAEGGEYKQAKPLLHGIACVNKAYENGYHIILFTARYGHRENGNIHKQYNRGFIELSDWLYKHGCKYHELIMGKPAGVLYVDDKAVRINSDDHKGWKQFHAELFDLTGKDRYGNSISQPDFKK